MGTKKVNISKSHFFHKQTQMKQAFLGSKIGEKIQRYWMKIRFILGLNGTVSLSSQQDVWEKEKKKFSPNYDPCKKGENFFFLTKNNPSIFSSSACIIQPSELHNSCSNLHNVHMLYSKQASHKGVKAKVDLYRLVLVGKRGFHGSALSKQVNTPCFCMAWHHQREEKIAFCSIWQSQFPCYLFPCTKVTVLWQYFYEQKH